MAISRKALAWAAGPIVAGAVAVAVVVGFGGSAGAAPNVGPIGRDGTQYRAITPAVECVQEGLNIWLDRMGDEPYLLVNGRFQSGTETAVKELQRYYGYQQTGVVGWQEGNVLYYYDYYYAEDCHSSDPDIHLADGACYDYLPTNY
jgi:peptidoglycan hydrolase-like protein with peptidoglycan-binding domain